MNPITTVFLDRDGVINVDSPDYIKSWPAFHFIPGSLEAIVRLSRAGYRVIVITNQSAVGRGMITAAELASMHDKLCQAVAAKGGRITDIFVCPHHPDDACDCRKPKSGMILAARNRYTIDLTRSVMIGDSAKDILAGKAAGCRRTVLVRTGNGAAAIASLEKEGSRPDHVAADLRQAVSWLIGQPE